MGRYHRGEVFPDDHEALIAGIQQLHVGLIDYGDVEVGGVEVAGVFGKLKHVLPFAYAHHVLGLGQLDTVLEGKVVPDLLESFSVSLEVGESVVDLQAQKG